MNVFKWNLNEESHPKKILGGSLTSRISAHTSHAVAAPFRA